LEHVELADLQRNFFYSDLNEAMYREFVLSPVLIPGNSEDLNWRRPLWENCYPCIRRETDPSSGAQTVAGFLRERITVVSDPVGYSGVKAIWETERTDAAGFQIIYVAALRSVGIAARLGDGKKAELFTQGSWQPAPDPAFFSFLPDESRTVVRQGE